jgi:hypothetical protein
MPIAADKRMECRPISFGLSPYTESMVAMKPRRCAKAAFAVSSYNLPCLLSVYVYTYASGLGLIRSRRCTTVAAAEVRVTRFRLCYRIVAQVAFLELERDCHGVGEVEIRVLVRHDFVVFAEDEVFPPEWLGSPFAGGFEILAAAHCEKIRQDGEFVDRHQPRFCTRSRGHFGEEVE